MDIVSYFLDLIKVNYKNNFIEIKNDKYEENSGLKILHFYRKQRLNLK